MNGFFQVHRSLLNHPLWEKEPFTWGQAWIDLIGFAAFKPTEFFIRNKKYSLKVGQLGKSKVTLAKRWKWSRGKIIRFLDVLETEHMIVQQSVQHTTIITICNYSAFQDPKRINGTPLGTAVGTPNGTQVNNIYNNLETWVPDSMLLDACKASGVIPNEEMILRFRVTLKDWKEKGFNVNIGSKFVSHCKFIQNTVQPTNKKKSPLLSELISEGKI